MAKMAWIKGSRTASGMSQAHLALAAGVSRRTVVRAESGRSVSGESMRCISAVIAPGPQPSMTDGIPSDISGGWLPEASYAEAIDYAAEWALEFMRPFRGIMVAAHAYRTGHLWEAQESGGGLSHLPAAAEALSSRMRGYARSRSRTLFVSVRDGRPSIVLIGRGNGETALACARPLSATSGMTVVTQPVHWSRRVAELRMA